MPEEARTLDDERVRQAVAGDRDAYRALVSAYQQNVLRLCLRATGERMSAEDLAQEVFLKAFTALSTFRFDASFSTWLYRVTVRTCLDWRRSAERERRKLGAAERDAAPAIDATTPEAVAVQKERTTELRLLVEGLREPYRTVTKLYYLDERSYKEIAERTDTPLKTVQSQVYRARQILREGCEVLR